MSQVDWKVSPEAASVHTDALVWDNHTCMPLRPDDSFLPELQRFRDSGVDVASVNVYFDNSIEWHDGVKVLAFMRRWILERPEDYALAVSVEDILDAKKDGKLAVHFDIEGMEALDGESSLVKTYYDLGVRWMLIAYNRNNRAGGGCMDDDTGLTDFGKQVIDEAARVGMLICCSHTGEQTCMEVFEQSQNPVLLSHSNPKSLCDHPRNVSDAVMVACSETGGIVGITGYGIFLANGDTSSDNIVRHIDYAVSLVGPEHVALGMDYVFDKEELKMFLKNKEIFPFDSTDRTMTSPEEMPALTEAMLRFGYPEETIRGILGENLLRVARQVWK
ncbi:MAG: membrane dipeptidase [Rhodothermia bacterium]|nr:MAG: membrane dipeptidase [Rhodothermia bacterium]